MGKFESTLATSGAFTAAGGGAMSAYAAIAYPEWAKTGFWGGAGLMVIGVILLVWAILHKETSRVDDKKQSPTVGLDIENNGDGVGMDVHSTGNLGDPAAESVIHTQPGQGAIGTRVVQRGPGVGLRVTQTGPGVGFRSAVVVGAPTTFKAEGGGHIEVDGAHSTAHTFGEAKDGSSISARNIRHEPDQHDNPQSPSDSDHQNRKSN
jgi:hypothetical protein